MSNQLIEELSSQVIAAQKAYYEGEPIMTDAEYDALEAQLRTLDPKNSVLSKVGDSSIIGGRIPHSRPMRSIENFYTIESFIAETKNYGATLVEEPKFDGVSVELTYVDGVLTRAVSRGDGDSGEDMSPQIKVCRKIPQTIDTEIHDLRIRGELVMRDSELARINALGGKQYANTRNLTAGTMKQLDLSIVESREIICKPWDMYSPNEDSLLPDSAYERMQLAEIFGFGQYEGYRVHRQDEEDIKKVLNILLARTNDIATDGVVIKVDSHSVRYVLGVGTKFTNYQHCFKPQNLAAETTLIDIEYGLGRTGTITPVAILEPVNLGGAMISRANLCNETYMNKLGVHIGGKVLVLRSGNVIPFIVSATPTTGSTAPVYPTVCPACGSTLKIVSDTDTTHHLCDNSTCPGKAAEQFVFVGKRETLEIDNLGDSMAEELVNRGITNLAQLFDFGNAIRESSAIFGLSRYAFRSNVNTMKMVNSLEKAKTATWDRWIASLGIESVGHTLGKVIATELNLTEDDMEHLPYIFQTKLPMLNIAGLGEVKSKAIADWAKNSNNIELCKNLHDAGIRPTPLANPTSGNGVLSGIQFCITGGFAMGSRPTITTALEKLGAVSHSSVNKKCNLVIVGEGAGSKLEKAKSLGIKTVGEEWLKEYL